MQTTSPSLLSRIRDPADRAAWEEFDRRYREMLARFFRRRHVPFLDSEDLVQSVFAQLVRSLPQFTYDPGRGKFRDYLFRCARNALAAWRDCPRRDGQPLVLVGDAPARSHDVDPAEAAIWEEEWVAHHYRMAMSALREVARPRDVLILERSMAGEAVAGLARDLGMEEPAVYKVRQRIRARMEALIAAQIADEDRIDDGR